MSDSAHPLEIDVMTLHQRREAGEELLVIDCREANEYEFVHLADTTLIPMNEITERVGELADHKDEEIIVHCHHGGRSMRVVQWLRQQGFAKATNLAGGIDEWSLKIDSSLPRY
ncbi:rhodanese-like domain-containing protein [Calycomorphotria hydatis]|uniref:Putative adenylyltransferase/sulfurtransferase MoeZ n=1 Tax=Calycomorphotria hydatis TaxID=2528027 RepID=A0A517TAX1_9PLAN|nr:rhodanese-like domain-containing protein [Calycomorphotria hydatis]QDT65519.1 putative adenylyltransferase/sulfurtransferase MoeZ [Calycomorphotria hydatis]